MATVFMCLFSVICAGEWNVLDFGAKGDGETDNTVAFQNALDDAAKHGGGVVNVPAGHYRISGCLSIPGAVTLQGTFRMPPSDQREGREKLDGSVLLAYANRGNPSGDPFIRLAGSMATIAGFTITYPEWSEQDVPPVPYPPTIFAQGTVNNGIFDCCLLNSYEGIVLFQAARFLVRNVFGYPSKRGLYVDECYDIGRVENVHFWPFGTIYEPEKPYSKWINLNGVAFEFARTDWQYVLNTFCFGYGVGYKFSTSSAGSCNGNFVGIGADCCERPVVVDTRIPLDILIVNGEFVGRWGSTEAIGVEIIGESPSRISLANCSFWGPFDRCIWLRAPEGRLNVSATGFISWDSGGEDSPAVQIDGGKAILQGNTFEQEGLHVWVGRKAESVILMGNQAAGGFQVKNEAGKRTQIIANEETLSIWPRGSKRNYKVLVGSPGDTQFLKGFHFREESGFWGKDKPMRWGGKNPRLILPVEKGKSYTLTLDVFIPEHAIEPDMGVYLEGTKLAELPASRGMTTVVAKIPPQNKETIQISLKAKSWSPSQVGQSSDGRVLSVALHQIVMYSGRAPKKVYNANEGSWEELTSR